MSTKRIAVVGFIAVILLLGVCLINAYKSSPNLAAQPSEAVKDPAPTNPAPEGSTPKDVGDAEAPIPKTIEINGEEVITPDLDGDKKLKKALLEGGGVD